MTAAEGPVTKTAQELKRNTLTDHKLKHMKNNEMCTK
jgi:hypothetical protein